MYKSHYQRFAQANPGVLHFAAHSHHWWPDVTREAVLQCWDDASRYVDDKWEYLYSHLIPSAQQAVATWLGNPSPSQIVFGSNTHEFVVRLLSCFAPNSKIRILTTSSEFHSFSRQLNMLEELGLVEVTRLSPLPIATLEERMLEASRQQTFEMIFFSHVFFDSGLCCNIAELVPQLETEGMIVIDGYHSFAALPDPMQDLTERVFFLGGGYKYAQSGEGVCFLAVPPSHPWTPTNTGWFAEFGNLSHRTPGKVPFPDDAQRFAGATFDPTGIYRFVAVAEWLEQLGMNIALVHEYVQTLQGQFIAGIERSDGVAFGLTRDHLLYDPTRTHGHFLTFTMDSPEQAAAVQLELWQRLNIRTDCRSDRLRFGFGLYQDASDVAQLLQRLRN